MADERRRAALAALCVFAVALAATLFPASGFGSYPAGVGTGGQDASPGGVTAPDRPEQSPPTETTAATATTATTGTPTTGTGSDDPTATTTETTTAAAEPSDDGGTGGLLAGLGLLALLGGVVAVVAGFRTGTLAVENRRAGPFAFPFTITVRGTPVGQLVGAIPTRTMALVVGLSVSVPRLLDDAATLTREVGGGLSTVARRLSRGTVDAARIGARGLGAAVTAVPRALAGLGAGGSALSGLGNVGLPSIGGRDGGRDPSPATSDPDPEKRGPPSVEEAWATLEERVGVPNRSARTPGEFARAAVERGYPDEAVRRLTDAFREVRYGDLPRTDRTDTARSALDRLRKHWGDDE